MTSILATWGYLAVFAFVAIESAGVPFPGETVLIAGSVYAGSGHLQIWAVIAAAALGGSIGFVISYTIGRTGGRALAYRYGQKVHIKPEHLERAEGFFSKYGDITVVLGRFISAGRALIALLAGINSMPLAKFLIFNVVGAVAWSLIFGILGFELGHNLQLLHAVTKYIEYGGGALGVIAVIALVVWLSRRRLAALVRR